ncbi:CDP-alcohol phosphatidyltransferase family protein [Anaerosporobacter faecicola]|uniref:CDP-alcohol phosphatidyltransferase family protein n=1 Tax=Anaerosporobacter faecicola TaxID=2718714 RepID=UPI001EE604C4|nr:CDP-alcohol phosphatidyltransferase family protein [Anaerosporobacter faecicola]
MREKRMIGFYNFSVVLTYIGLAFSIYGMTQALSDNHKIAFLCLMMSGLCDMFDGKIARAMDRTEDEKRFGIQIDSLCDLICFGMFPAIIVYSFGATGVIGNACIILYVLAAVIRLGFFNVMEEKRQSETTENRKLYQGLPVTSVAIILPLVYLLRDFFTFVPVLEGVLVAIAFLFVLNFKVKKPNKSESVVMIACATVIFLKVLELF